MYFGESHRRRRRGAPRRVRTHARAAGPRLPPAPRRGLAADRLAPVGIAGADSRLDLHVDLLCLRVMYRVVCRVHTTQSCPPDLPEKAGPSSVRIRAVGSGLVDAPVRRPASHVAHRGQHASECQDAQSASIRSSIAVSRRCLRNAVTAARFAATRSQAASEPRPLYSAIFGPRSTSPARNRTRTACTTSQRPPDPAPAGSAQTRARPGSACRRR